MFKMLDSAIAFGATAHAMQVRKYTGEPYICHPIEVMQTVLHCSSLPVSEDMLVAAVLHDVVEDTPVALDTIERRFGLGVSRLVFELTDQFVLPAQGNRSTRKALERQRLATISGQAQSIKYADLISNTASIARHDPGFARTYLREKEEVLRVMVDGDPELRLLAYTSLAHGETMLVQHALKEKGHAYTTPA